MKVDSFAWNNNAPDVCRLVHGQVDWLSEEVGKIGVSRNEFEFSRSLGWQMHVELRQLVEDWVVGFLDRHARSAYDLINCHLAATLASEPERICWILYQGTRIQEIDFPAATNLDARWCTEKAGRLAWRGRPVTILPALEIQLTSGSSLIGIHPKFEIFAPTAIGLYPHTFGIAAVFGEWRRPPDRPVPGVSCDFPPAWSKLAAIHFSNYGSRNCSQYLWNRATPVVQSVGPDIWALIRLQYSSLTPEALQGFEGLTRRQRDERAPVFLLHTILEDKAPPPKLLARCPPEWLPFAFGRKFHRSRVLKSATHNQERTITPATKSHNTCQNRETNGDSLSRS